MRNNDWSDLTGIPENIMSQADAEANAWLLVQTGHVKFRFNNELELYEFALSDKGCDAYKNKGHEPGHE